MVRRRARSAPRGDDDVRLGGPAGPGVRRLCPGQRLDDGQQGALRHRPPGHGVRGRAAPDRSGRRPLRPPPTALPRRSAGRARAQPAPFGGLPGPGRNRLQHGLALRHPARRRPAAVAPRRRLFGRGPPPDATGDRAVRDRGDHADARRDPADVEPGITPDRTDRPGLPGGPLPVPGLHHQSGLIDPRSRRLFSFTTYQPRGGRAAWPIPVEYQNKTIDGHQ
ncbi:hypothetical protein SGPA1_41243 [Streptomyces misionensis JCM 4497]